MFRHLPKIAFTLKYLKGTDKNAFASGPPDLAADECKTFRTCIYGRFKWTIGSSSLASCVLQATLFLLILQRSVTGAGYVIQH